jgi:hypothetical protein
MELAEVRVEEVFNMVLENPGDFSCDLFRRDGIVQIDPIQQLYANWFRKTPYKFIANTTHETSLAEINDYIQDHDSDFIAHIEECHNDDYETLHHAVCSPKCKSPDKSLDKCICSYVQTIHKTLVAHCNAISLNALALGNNTEVCDKVYEEYTQFVTAIIIFEQYLPCLSEMFGHLKAKRYRFSLWKFLHQEFVDLVLTPLLPQLMDGLCNKLKACRRQSITPALNGSYASRQHNNCHWISFELMESVMMTLTMLVNGDLDECSVHTLESTKGDLGAFYQMFEEQLSQQTQELYQEFQRQLDGRGDWKVAISNDCTLLERLLRPRSLRSALDNCLSTVQNLWSVEETIFCHDFAAEHLHDLDVDIYFHKLVTLPLTPSL